MKSYTFILAWAILGLLSCSTANKLSTEQKLMLTNSKRLIKVLPEQIDVDKLGNVYVLDNLGHLQVYAESGTKKYEFADKRLGKVSSFDVSNPLNILVYFKEQGIVKILDNTLAEVKTINLMAQGKNTTVGPICLANDNNIWMYDAQLQKIVKINADLKTLVETNQFNDLGRPKFVPTKMMERNNMLVVSSADDGFLVFDNFGQMSKYFDIPGAKDFQFDGEKILLQTQTGLKSQAIDYPAFFTVGLPSGIEADKIKQIKMENKKWYIAYYDGIDWVNKK
jgi:hypothetical protein